MSFDFSKIVSRETNSVVNKALSATQKYVSTSVNQAAGDRLKAGTEKLLSGIGAPNIVREAVRNVNAQVVQAGVGAAGEIVSGLINGAISSSALSKFTSLDAVKTALKTGNPLAKNVMSLNVLAGHASIVKPRNPPVPSPPSSGGLVSSESSPYAVDFTDTFGPKFSFLFAVQFIYNDPFSSDPVLAKNDFNTLVYKFERPTIEIEHDEINIYNFFTQYPKRTRYSSVSFSAYDDAKDNTLSAFVSYLRTISPIFDEASSSLTHFEDSGMNFNRPSQSSNLSSIQQNPYPNSSDGLRGFDGLQETGGPIDSLTSILREIKIYHVTDFGKFIDVYVFVNPKFTKISLDELDMTENKANSFTFEFVYDKFYMKPQQLPSQVPPFEQMNMGARYNITNRDVAQGSNMRAAQMEKQAAEAAEKAATDLINKRNAAQTAINNLAVDRESILQEAGIKQGLDITNDYAVEQFWRDREFMSSAPPQNASTLPSLSSSSIISGIKKIFK